MDTSPNPMFAKFDQVLGKTTPTTNTPQVTTRASEIRALANPPASIRPMGQNIASDIKKRGEGVYGAITGTSEESKGEDALTRGLQATGEAFGAITDVAGDVVSGLVPKGVKERFAQQTEEGKNNPIRKAISGGYQEIMDKVGIGLDDLISKHPALGKEIETALKKSKALGDISGGILTADATAKTIQGAVDTTGKVINKGGQVIENAQNKAQKYAEKSLKDDWVKPTETNKAGFKKPAEIYKNASEQGHDISDTLVKNKISLADNVEEGRYSTLDTADNLRNDTQKMYKDVLRPSLEQADYSTPRTPVADVIDKAQKNINANKYITQETKDTLIRELDSTNNALRKRFPEGMSLTDIGDEKIVRDINAKYNVLGDIASNNEASKNKAIADSLRGLLEEKAPKEIPVHEFNAELTKQHQAADYLESLHTKTVPKSVASRIAKTIAKVVGATVGHGIGGGVLGGVGGYHIGGMLEGMLENIPNPFKASFLKNLEVTNPEAFQAVSDYLGAEEVARLQRLALPAPSTIYAEPKGTPNQIPYQGEPIAGQSTNLDHSPSVAQPMSKINNISMPESVTRVEEKVKDFVKNPKMGLSVENVTKNISSAEKGTLRDFTDYVNGSMKLKGKALAELKSDVQDIAKKYGFSKAFSGDKALSNQIGEYLDKIGYLKGEGAIPKQLYHGTSAKEFDQFSGINYFTEDPKEAQGFAEGVHLGGGKGGTTRVIKVSHSMKNVKNIDSAVEEALMEGNLDEAISKEVKIAKKEGYDTVSFTHPSNYTDGDFTAYVPVDNASVKINKK